MRDGSFDERRVGCFEKALPFHQRGTEVEVGPDAIRRQLDRPRGVVLGSLDSRRGTRTVAGGEGRPALG